MGEVWPTVHVTELCLQLTVGSRPANGNELRALGSQSCKRVLLTMGDLPLPNFMALLVNISRAALANKLYVETAGPAQQITSDVVLKTNGGDTQSRNLYKSTCTINLTI